MSQVIHVTSEIFEAEILKCDIPVVIDFFAAWCPPCRMLMPVLERLANEFDGLIKFVKIDSDAESELAGEFNVTGLPTLVFVEEGESVGQFVGLPQEDALRIELKKWIESRKPMIQ